MKKFVSSILAMIFLVSLALTVSADGIELSLQNCTVDSDGCLVSYTGGYYDSISIPSVIDGAPVKSVVAGLFYGQTLNTVYLGDGIEEIQDMCFANSTLAYIDIPASVKNVGTDAFKDCKDLYCLAIGSDQTEFGEGAFSGTGFLDIAVPCTSDLLVLHDKIRDAKGDEEFNFDVMHVALEESMVEKDIFGHNMIFCSACGFKGSVFIDDIDLPFEDVSDDTWYYQYVVTAYEFGILNGKSETVFDPNANMTLAEAAKIAACIHAYTNFVDADFQAADGEAWYGPYINYCYEQGIIDSHIVFDWDKNATRAEMAYLFARADDGYYEINPDVPLTDIPDVDENTMFYDSILALYRRGIATGSDVYYSYYPDSNVKRSEAAAFISRILCYDMRVDLPKG